MTHNLASPGTAPYGVAIGLARQPPGVTQVDNTLATMGRGLWLCNETDRLFAIRESRK
jgi:hypothetical protein